MPDNKPFYIDQIKWSYQGFPVMDGVYLLVATCMEPTLDQMSKPYTQLCGYAQLVCNPDLKIPYWRILLPDHRGNTIEIEEKVRFYDLSDAMLFLQQYVT